MLSIGAASADSISPLSVTETIALGETILIDKVVTVSTLAPVSSKVDVLFLADTTGSMDSVITAVAGAAGNILDDTKDIGDVYWGVAEYKDFEPSPWGSSGDFPWLLNTAMTDDTAVVAAGITGWTASGGNDQEESNLYALSTSAIDASVGWRADAEKIIVWFGDQPGHDPDTTTGYPGPTLADTISTLTDAGVTVIGVDSGNLDGTGQATAITVATSGSLFNLTSTAGIGTLISNAITTAFKNYTSVSLAVAGDSSCVDVAIDPLSHDGAWSREFEETFGFNVSFTGVSEGECHFTINALVDGSVVAVEEDWITVTPVPLPATLPMLFGALLAGGAFARRRKS